MKIFEQTILVSRAQSDDAKFNILEFRTRKFIEEIKEADIAKKFNLFEIRFRAIPDSFIKKEEKP